MRSAAASTWRSRESVLGLGRVILVDTMTFGLSLLGFSATNDVCLAAPLLALAGGGFMVQTASTNTIIQTIVDERFRGRVIAFYTMTFLGTTPIGSLLGGIAADRIGAPATVAFGVDVIIISGACSLTCCRRCACSCGRFTFSSALSRRRTSMPLRGKADQNV
jgi:MFS family permease